MWGFQVNVRDPTPDDLNHHSWKWCRASNTPIPYMWETQIEAQEMARMCYGNDPSIVRVKEFPNENPQETKSP